MLEEAFVVDDLGFVFMLEDEDDTEDDNDDDNDVNDVNVTKTYNVCSCCVRAVRLENIEVLSRLVVGSLTRENHVAEVGWGVVD